MKIWTAKDEAFLREHYRTMPLRTLAGRLKKTICAVKVKSLRLGLVRRPKWRADELDYLRRHYGKEPPAEIAAHLERPIGQVYQAAARYGLVRPPPVFTEAMEAVLRRRHAEGWTDAAIARELGTDRRTLRDRRADLGLPVNAESVKAVLRENAYKQAQSLGITPGGQLRERAYRQFALENGWPEDLRPREVQILNVLAAAGVPMTRLELARAIGMRTDRMGGNGTLALLAGNGPGGTYTASLLKRGLLSVLRRGAAVTGQGQGRSRDLYYLGPEALKLLTERAERCETKTAN